MSSGVGQLASKQVPVERADCGGRSPLACSMRLMAESTTLPALRGGLIALTAALLFGVSTPLVQRFGVGIGSFSTAALLYAGAALVGALIRQPAEREARLKRSDGRRIVLMAFFGAAVGPVALAWGLQHTSGTSASLMLTLEAVFTAVLARLWYHETLDRRVTLAMTLLTLGGMALVLDRAQAGASQVTGLLAVITATAAWGVDNTLSRGVAERDPGQVVMVKGALGALATAVLAFAFHESTPPVWAAIALLVVGATGYGLSLRFYLLAQRAFGAARTGSVFAFAPFVGAVVAAALGERGASPWMFGGATLMIAGIVLHLVEGHEHDHEHEATEHEHAHTHEDGHHDHTHDPMPGGPHSHVHRHAPIRHAHAHVPDEHHAHRH